MGGEFHIMFTLRSLILSERMRSFMMVVILVVFVVFGVQIILSESNLTTQIFYVVFLSFFTFFFVLSEVLRFMHRKMVYALNIEVNHEKALYWLNKIQKFDIIKEYQQTYYVFKTLYHRDLGEFEALKTLLEHPIFQRSASLKLIDKVNRFYIAIEEKNDDIVQSLYKEIYDAYFVKTKKSRTPRYVYDIHQISADYHIYKKNASKAHDELKQVLLDKLNPREQTYYHVSFAKYSQLKQKGTDLVYLNKAKEIAPHVHHVVHYAKE